MKKTYRFASSLHLGLLPKDKAISNRSNALPMQLPTEVGLHPLNLSLMFVFTVQRCLTVID
jgi:hypothetical protein